MMDIVMDTPIPHSYSSAPLCGTTKKGVNPLVNHGFWVVFGIRRMG